MDVKQQYMIIYLNNNETDWLTSVERYDTYEEAKAAIKDTDRWSGYVTTVPMRLRAP